jgi:hypothetical protein
LAEEQIPGRSKNQAEHSWQEDMKICENAYEATDEGHHYDNNDTNLKNSKPLSKEIEALAVLIYVRFFLSGHDDCFVSLHLLYRHSLLVYLMMLPSEIETYQQWSSYLSNRPDHDGVGFLGGIERKKRPQGHMSSTQKTGSYNSLGVAPEGNSSGGYTGESSGATRSRLC